MVEAGAITERLDYLSMKGKKGAIQLEWVGVSRRPAETCTWRSAGWRGGGGGLGIGVVGALWLSRLLSGFVFRIKTTDPATYLMVAGGLAAVAVLDCLIPSRTVLTLS